MASYLRLQYRKLLKALRQDGSSDEKMHKLRLRMKKIGDIGELAELLYRGARHRRFMKCLSKLQSSLGKRQDAVVGRQLAILLGKAAPQAAQKAIAVIVGLETTRIAERTISFASATARLLRLKTFWRKSA